MLFQPKDKPKILGVMKASGQWDGVYTDIRHGIEFRFRCEGETGERRMIADATRDGASVSAEGTDLNQLFADIETAAAAIGDSAEWAVPTKTRKSSKRTESPAPTSNEPRQDEGMKNTATTETVETKTLAEATEQEQTTVMPQNTKAPKATKKAIKAAVETVAAEAVKQITSAKKSKKAAKLNPAVEALDGGKFRWFGHAVGRVLHWMGGYGFNAFEATNILRHYGLPEMTPHSVSSRIAEGRSEKWRNPAKLDKSQAAELKGLKKQFAATEVA